MMTTDAINTGSRGRGRPANRLAERVVRRVTVSLNEVEARDLDHHKDRSRRSIGAVYSDAEALRRAVSDWRFEPLPCDEGYVDPLAYKAMAKRLAMAETAEAMIAARDEARRTLREAGIID